jgi:two-component system phosphate regulon response regulator PhoB
MAHEKILIVDDEEDIIELLSYNLSREGYRVEGVQSGEQAIEKVRSVQPDIIVLDLMLPGIDGLEVCRILKNDPAAAYIPIIMLTAKGEDADIVAGLELGADDYITKPFSPRILLARIRAVIRRDKKGTGEQQTVIKKLNIAINVTTHEVLVNEAPVDLTPTEFSILLHMIQRPRWVFTRNQIINAVKGNDYPVTDRSVDVQIVGLRKKLGLFGSHIQTVRGVGYRFKE